MSRYYHQNNFQTDRGLENSMVIMGSLKGTLYSITDYIDA